MIINDVNNKKTKNLLIVPMSIFPRATKSEDETSDSVKLIQTKYYCPKNSKSKYITTDGYQLEPIPEYINEEYGLDSVLMVNTDSTDTGLLQIVKVLNKQGEIINTYNSTNPKKYLTEKIKQINPNIEILECTVGAGEATQEDINTIIQHIRDYAETNDYNIRIFLDVHGGLRTTSSMLTILSSLLPLRTFEVNVDDGSTKRIYINDEDIYSVIFDNKDQENNEIVHAGEAYSLLDLVTGVHEFVEYGRVDLLEEYSDKLAEMKKIVSPMKDISDGLAIANIDLYKKGLEKLKEVLSRNEQLESKTSEMLVSILKQEYDPLLNNIDNNSKNDDPRNLILWNKNKKFYQFALTLCAEKTIPYLIESDLLNFDKLKDRQERLKDTSYNFYLMNCKNFKIGNFVIYALVRGLDVKDYKKRYSEENSYYFIETKLGKESQVFDDFLDMHRIIKQTRNNANHAGDSKGKVLNSSVANLSEGITHYIDTLNAFINLNKCFDLNDLRLDENYQSFKEYNANSIIDNEIFGVLKKGIIKEQKKEAFNDAKYRKGSKNSVKEKNEYQKAKDIYESALSNYERKHNTQSTPVKENKKAEVHLEEKKNNEINTVETNIDSTNIQKSAPHWIHKTIKSSAFVSGYRTLPECDCSECGFTANSEKPKCPRCGAIMK